MAERKWTSEQLSAIEARGKTLLVSAAAGSGKTATLTERIIRRLLDKDNPVTVDSLLIVTYTKAAAGELRQKISSALADAVQANPGDEGLLRQLMMLPSAKIKTIDSFCNDLLRANVDRVGLAPSYRISTGAECNILSTAILEGLIEAVYRGDAKDIATPEEFEELAECLTNSKHTEELADVMKFVYDECQSSLEGTEILRSLLEIYSPEKYSGVDECLHGKYIINRANAALSHHIDRLGAYRRDLLCGNSLDAMYAITAKEDMEMLQAIFDAEGYKEKREKIQKIKFEEISSIPKGSKKTPLMCDFAAYREIMKADIKKQPPFFSFAAEEWEELYKSLYRVLGVLCKFIFTFDRIFTEEKRQRGIVTYADIERYTYKCLWQDGKPTDIAENLAAQFSEIYIDEYQDVNALQDKIFEAIAKPNNRFMVGDIKQSIYGFRSARPEIFAQMKATFPPLAESEGNTASIFMSSNFRCDKGVVDFTNDIFDRMFSLLGDSIGYLPGDRLGYAKIHDSEPPYQRPQVVVTVPKKYREPGDISAPDAVAKKIKQLLAEGRLDSGERVRPSDIALILRTSTPLDSYVEALEREGIPMEISIPEDFFKTPEVLLILSFLYTVDNPRRDIYLAGLMVSPLFGFNGQELATIRRSADCETLYEALCQYTEEHPDFAKGRAFLDKLDYYRSVAENIPVDKLIYKIYHETGLLSLAARHGGKQNLMFLYDHSRSFASGAFKGLYNFITYIENVISGKITTEFEEKRAGSTADAVKIITAHSSKGLEYPIVFFAHAQRSMSGMRGNFESKDRWIKISEEMGIGLLLKTPSGLARVKNPVFLALSEFEKEKSFEEELRVLYVILTRAREQLYVVGDATTKKIDTYVNKLRIMKDNLSPYSAKTLSNYLEVILVSTGIKGRDPYDFIATEGEALDAVVLEGETVCPSDEGIEISSTSGVLCDELTRRFTYTYDKSHMSELPEKMSVSRLTPTVLDGTEGEAVEIISPDEDEDRKDTLPAFMTGTDEAESAKRGIATHYFMQFCDLDRFVNEGSEAELGRLVNEKYISAEDGERVRIKELEQFRRSPLLSKMLGAEKLYRELRFNVRLPAKYFTEDAERRALYADETVLVQGVIDCIIIDNKGDIHLIDYKTDRLTREERADRHLGEEKLRTAHTTQLSYYALAIKEMFGKLPKTIGVYSLHLGVEVEITNRFSE